MPNIVNRLISAEYQADFATADALLLVSMGGLTVVEVEKLRVQLGKSGVQLRMVRNSLARRVLAERGYEFGDVMSGPMGVVFGGAEGAILAAKAMTSPEVRKAGKVSLRGGLLEGARLNAADALALADVPDKQALRAQLVGVIQAPLRGLAVALNALPGGIARVVQAHVDQRTEAEAAPASEDAAPAEAAG